jgi:hypothetical protein
MEMAISKYSIILLTETSMPRVDHIPRYEIIDLFNLPEGSTLLTKNLPAGQYWVKNPSDPRPNAYLIVRAFSPERARQLIQEVGERGYTFHVHFIKRTTGEERKMVCRLGVKKGVKGVLKPGERKAEDAATDNITVYEMGVGFKRIPLDAVIYVSGSIPEKKVRTQKGGGGSSPGEKGVVAKPKRRRR